MSRGASLAIFASLLLLTAGCATTRIAPSSVQLRQAQAEIPADQLIDVVIAPLATGVPDDPAELDDDVFPEVRKAEARFFAVQLKRTLERTGEWGSVSVAPSADDVGLSVQGEIVASDGETLTLHAVATDATGRQWLDQRYHTRLPVSMYREPAEEMREPFQDLYNHIANDLLEVREALPAEAVAEVRQVAELRFAASLAPEAFGDHIETDADGRTRILRLPAEDDPMLERVRAVYDRDQAVRETLDESYVEFYRDMEEPYQRWRSFTAEETVALRRIQREAYLRMGLGALATIGGIVLGTFDGGLTAQLLSAPLIVGGIYGVTAGAAKHDEAMLHVGAVEELGRSFEADVAPRVVQVEGETFRISGNTEAQYREWRRLLRAIYSAETGLLDSEPIFDLGPAGGMDITERQ